MTPAHHADMLAAAARSAQLVGEHDRDGWIALLYPPAPIEDTVG